MKKQYAYLALISCFLFTPLALAKSILVSHPMGETLLETKPQRVVVLGMDTLDILNHLGIRPVGLVKAPIPTYLSHYNSDDFVSVGSLFEPDFEAIYNLKPDLIIVSNRSSESFDKLSQIAPSVLYMPDPLNYWQSTQDAWRMLGKIFERESDIETIITEQSNQIDRISTVVKNHNFNAMVVMKSGDNISTFGPESRYRLVFDTFGFKPAMMNEKKGRHGDLISYEYILTTDPDFVLYLDRDMAIKRGSAKKQDFSSHPIMKKLSAFKDKRILSLRSEAWYVSASGIQANQMVIDDVSAGIVSLQ